LDFLDSTDCSIYTHIIKMSRSLSSLQPLRNIVSRQARPSSSVASRVLAARRTYSTEKEAPKEGEAKDENAEKIAGLESKIKELEVSFCSSQVGYRSRLATLFSFEEQC
jgi:hypothetical protein